MKKILVILLSLVLFAGCEEEVNIPLDSANPRLVIEGVFTDEEKPQTIFVSETNDYYSTEEAKGVSGAVVTISDSQGGSEILTEEETGVYKTSSLYGQTGVTYTLNVTYQGSEYEASGTIQTPPIFDSLTYRFVEETPLKDEGYYLYFFGKTPKPAINYYRWLVYLDDTIHGTDPEDFLLASDEFVTEQLSDLEFPFNFEVDDRVRLEMYSIDQSMFTYYNELLSILFNDGGLFSPPPVNPRSNIVNLTDPGIPPLGYFQVSAIVSEEVIIEAP